MSEDTPSTRKIRCEFCDSTILNDGSFVELSSKAKKFRDAAVKIEQLEEANRELKEQISEFETKLAEARAAANPPAPSNEPPKRKSIFAAIRGES